MKNPSLQRQGKTPPTQSTEPVMDQFDANVQGYNTFDMSINSPTSQRFGEAVPTFFFEGVAGDRLIHRLSESLKANQLVSPLMSEIRAYEDVFTVPISSLYPTNWQKMVTNPTKGDDLPADALPNFDVLTYLRRLVFDLDAPDISSVDASVYIDGSAYSVPNTLKNSAVIFSSDMGVISGYLRLSSYMRALGLLSSDSLLSRTGFMPDAVFTVTDADDSVPVIENLPVGYKYNLQYLVSLIYTQVLDIVSALQNNYSYTMTFFLPTTLDDTTHSLSTVYGSYESHQVPLTSLSVIRDWLFRTLSQGGFFAFTAVEGVTGAFPTVGIGGFFFVNPTQVQNRLGQLFSKFRDAIHQFDSSSDADAHIYNPSRLLAYNQTIAAYYSNPTVDYIYTAQLYMQNLQSSFMNPVIGTSGTVYNDIVFPTFMYNGVRVMYDLLTDGFVNLMFREPANYYFRLASIYANLFSFGNSLRKQDFLVSARPNILAVGDVMIDVSQSNVSAVDTIQGILKARFLQIVNRVSSEIHSYLDGVFGVSPVNDMPEPHFCSRQRLSVSRDINTNVSDSLGQQNTNLRGESTSTGVDIFLDEFCIVLGIRSFSVVGSYRRGINPHLYNNDRFSMFNPLLQAFGDQPIDVTAVTGTPQHYGNHFGYTERYGEYKMPLSQATGAASSPELDSWFFFFDDLNPNSYSYTKLDGSTHISPSYIRHYPIEFDKFFAPLSTIDPARYYHFVISDNCQLIAQRKMSFNSALLFLK